MPIRPTALQLTTNPGLEAMALEELCALAGVAGLPVTATEVRPHGLAGHLGLTLDAPWSAVAPLCRRPRSTHRVVRTVGRFLLDPVDPLRGIEEAVAALTPTIPELAPEHVRFRATCKRIGTHPFTSEEVARVAGAGVRSVQLRQVKLKGFDVELRCDVHDDRCTLGVTVARLSRRSEGPYSQRTSLRANMAWALLQRARPDPERPPRRLLDPCVGAGTILVEAGHRWPELALCGGDRLERAVEGAKSNLSEARMGARSTLRLGDVRSLSEAWPGGGFDTVVSNPPFGVRLGRSISMDRFYAELLSSIAAVCTPDAVLVLLVQKRGPFNRAVARSSWRIQTVDIVELGGLYPGIFTLTRR